MRNFWIFTAVRMEARALRRVNLMARPIGIGAKHLPFLATNGRIRYVLVAGVGGAIDPTLAVGDVVVDGPARFVLAGCRHGSIHTVDHVISTPAEKAATFAATGAAVIDMEQAIVRERIQRLDSEMQVIGVRAVSDAANDAIDPVVIRLVNEMGRPRPAAIAGALLRRPSLIPHLRRLNANTRTALDRLAATLPAIVEQIELEVPPWMQAADQESKRRFA